MNIAISILVISFSALILAAPAPQQAGNYNDVKVVRFVNDNNGIDNYQFTYELDNGQIFSEAGGLKEVETDNEKVNVIVVSGRYTFVGPDGVTYWVNYTADENGFHPVVGTGPEGGIKPGESAGLDPNTLKSLVG